LLGAIMRVSRQGAEPASGKAGAEGAP
jgi:hypothetical protein